ncbi:uncharacterized protein PITG_21421 [Phytophthora infestans T30-4]|uniref:Uncharacterized protein n=1 Tax=Phytophthora infestans (strain T30-4) TaxID=403677 RepID=D0P424_PHYIT|nr:uncharacterized protein PITG_21421 [Phytophthora infestans T30-4]EEY62750.1 hypothetical protein PITG_21421 [Phytophthora infestans T30-4]|eukprot:XP_002894950.1 hypothetical protein PITG_21421 [Phytophthora infestans T30-4]
MKLVLFCDPPEQGCSGYIQLKRRFRSTPVFVKGSLNGSSATCTGYTTPPEGFVACTQVTRHPLYGLYGLHDTTGLAYQYGHYGFIMVVVVLKQGAHFRSSNVLLSSRQNLLTIWIEGEADPKKQFQVSDELPRA